MYRESLEKERLFKILEIETGFLEGEVKARHSILSPSNFNVYML